MNGFTMVAVVKLCILKMTIVTMKIIDEEEEVNKVDKAEESEKAGGRSRGSGRGEYTETVSHINSKECKLPFCVHFVYRLLELPNLDGKIFIYAGLPDQSKNCCANLQY